MNDVLFYALHKMNSFNVSKANVSLEQGNACDIQNRRWIQTVRVWRDWKQKQLEWCKQLYSCCHMTSKTNKKLCYCSEVTLSYL